MTQQPIIQLQETKDGSHTLYRPDLNETYHSPHGALQESLYVFIEMGMAQALGSGKTELQLLEVGLGTGLNMLLTALEVSRRPQIQVHAVSLEPFPIDGATASRLNYPQHLPQHEEAAELLNAVHACDWENDVPITPRFTLHKTRSRLEDYQGEKNRFDLIYFDAFAPNKQADVWAQTNLEKCAEVLAPGGILVTYCAQGAFKRGLKATGLQVQALPGPPGKRSMTRALKAALSPRI